MANRQCAIGILFMLSIAATIPVAAQTPGEVTGVRWCAGAGKDCFQWSPVGAASSYRVYRGENGSLPCLLNTGVDSCSRLLAFSETTGAGAIPENPLSGNLLWFLVTAQNASGEGSPGNATSGPRVRNGSAYCAGACGGSGEACSGSSDCCAGNCCGGVCESSSCAAYCCAPSGAACSNPSECCDPEAHCEGGRCCGPPASCTTDAGCCQAGWVCQNSRCCKPPGQGCSFGSTDCCPGSSCTDHRCCRGPGGACTSVAECCDSGMFPLPCCNNHCGRLAGGSCSTNIECCSGACVGGTCQ